MEFLSGLFFCTLIAYLVFSWISRWRWMSSVHYQMATDMASTTHGLKNEIEVLRRETEYFKDEMRRAQVAKMYIRAGSSIFAKMFLDRAGNVLVTDNLFCRMLSDGILRKPTSMQFLPDALRGILVFKYGSDIVASHSSPSTNFTVDKRNAAVGSRSFGFHDDTQTYVLRIKTANHPSLEINIMVRTGAPNDYV